MPRGPSPSPPSRIRSALLIRSDRVQFLAEHHRPEHRRDVQKAAVRGSRPLAFSGSCSRPTRASSPSSTAAFLALSRGPSPAITTMEAGAHPGGAGPTFGAGDPQPEGSTHPGPRAREAGRAEPGAHDALAPVSAPG